MTAVSVCYANFMVFSCTPILDALVRLPFINKGELALVLTDEAYTGTAVWGARPRMRRLETR